jgi:hypothetical protein
MSTPNGNEPKSQKGSAMVISVLVTAIMSLLGISYLLMADTENKIAENEKLSAQCLYFGEATVREVTKWFDRPPYAALGGENLVKPLTTTMDRTLRQIDTDGDGPTAPVAADGTAAHPYYKVGVDRDGDGNDDIFDKPYRSGLADTLLGTETGPDIQIRRAASSTIATFLDGLGTKIAPSFPAGVAGLTARVNEIDIYEPPYLYVGGQWTRYGMGTVKAIVEIVKTSGATTNVVSSRVVKAVLNEMPYPGPYGPLHSCTTLNWNGSFNVHWGTTTAVGNANPKSKKFPNSIPRALPPGPQIDLLNFWQSPAQDANWAAMKLSLETAGATGQTIPDPWFRFIIGGVDADYSAVMSQQIVAPSATTVDNSNMFHRMDPLVNCVEFDYQTWKNIAQSGTSDVHYFAWDNGMSFAENGTGTVDTLQNLTDNRVGVYFFDTTDGNPPDSLGSNLTPEVSINGGTYGFRGFLYANVSNWLTTGVAGRAIDMVWPGEPFRDSNQNGVYDPGEAYINLNYKTISTTDPTVQPVASGTDDFGNLGVGPTRNAYGPHITGQTAIIWGVLFVSGTLDAQGNATYYGSVVTKGGTANKMTGTPDMWWDPRIKDNWPPADWDLPRVVITRWETDL